MINLIKSLSISNPEEMRRDIQPMKNMKKKKKKKMNSYLPEEVLEQIFRLLDSNQDRNNVSLVSKYWYKVDTLCRHKVIIPNCYALNPQRLISRFPKVKSLTLKGTPQDDTDREGSLVPTSWGCLAFPWIKALVDNCLFLDELKLKRMIVSDKTLELISLCFPTFKSLILFGCRGFSSNGLAAIASNCRFLEVLDLQENELERGGDQWLNCFPESFTSLVSFHFMHDKGLVDLVALEQLVGRCPNLKSLRLSRAVPLDTLRNILVQAPQLVDLGIGSFAQDTDSETYHKLCQAVRNCKFVSNLSGFLAVLPVCLNAIIPICSNLMFLNLRYAAGIPSTWLIRLISKCRKLQRLWVLNHIGDKGLEVVASTCKELQELRIYKSTIGRSECLTETGLVAISMGCPKLHCLHYFCIQMTNAALVTLAKNCPNITRFSLRILNPIKPDYITSQPFDEGFGAIVRSCEKLRHLSLSGLLTDQVCLYIGMYAEQLEMLSIKFSGPSDTGFFYVLNGCRRLRKLVIGHSSIGDSALLAAAEKYMTMQFVWLTSCNVSFGGCKALAKKVPTLNMKIKRDPRKGNAENLKVDEIYLYRILDGPQKDAPDTVWSQ